MTFAPCGVCEEPIDDPADAALLRDGPRDEDGPGEAAYRHTWCDPADISPDRSTVVEM